MAVEGGCLDVMAGFLFMINVSKMMGYLGWEGVWLLVGDHYMAAWENDVFCNICHTGEPGCYSNKIYVNMM